MRDVKDWRWEALTENGVPRARDFGNAARDICEKAFEDAREQLHPLLRMAALGDLDRRQDFLRAFKGALEQNIARKLAIWLPGVQAVFSYEESSRESWDRSIRLLVKVPRLSTAVKVLGKTLDHHLTKSLKQLGWKRFEEGQVFLEIHQVTPRELRHGLGYGAMFSAVYTAPIKLWSKES